MHNLRLGFVLCGIVLCGLLIGWRNPAAAPKGPDLHLVQELTASTYENEVLTHAGEMPVLIWVIRPERAAMLDSDARVMEQMAETWQGYIRFYRFDMDRVPRGSRLDDDFGISRGCSIDLMIRQGAGQGSMHHHDLYKMHHDWPLTVSDVQGQILDFKPDCMREDCPLCSGKPRLGRLPVAWR